VLQNSDCDKFIFVPVVVVLFHLEIAGLAANEDIEERLPELFSG
jgi:hypothetical protein